MSQILKLNPTLLWKWFATICSIPHASYHDQALADYIINWAKSKNYLVGTDCVGNILLRKPATQGYQNKPMICLQAHIDMVPQANFDKKHNFETDPIIPIIKGDMLYADGTTLGADNGIGLAAILAIFEDNKLHHGPIEAIMTRNEEVGMEGAKGLAKNWLQSKYLINLDTEEWGYLYLGCAGGIDLTFKKNYKFKSLKTDHKLIKITIKGFRGGHSGCDINTNRENAIIYLNKILFQIYHNVKFNLCDYYSGQARNAIPRESFAVIAYQTCYEDQFTKSLHEIITQVTKSLETYETEVQITTELVAEADYSKYQRLSCHDMPNLLNLLVNIPNGILRYSENFPGVVETSLSVGIMRLNPIDGFLYKILSRSINDDSNLYVATQLRGLANLADFEFEQSGFYHGWLPETNSFTDYIITRYNKAIGKETQIQIIHAGLECGILKGHYPQIQMASIGPNIYNPHTPAEHCDIPSVEKFYNLLIDILANIPDSEKL